ncbi:caspase family protein [Lewinella sp. JB7]|uniref:caspase family protein n=1 Tax=Lewinella sp. JB7 TaxID=2962887 RepID=UPI0020C9C43F|nr:caspase family protein [Lewinella sp. JB7]MCP9236633.1 caspase family protein [Lewinella sp. JB7]
MLLLPALLPAAAGSGSAVIVGISDFEDPNISDLRFADRDAEAFADFLASKQGGQLSSHRIKTLTNAGATLAAIESALSWQLSSAEAGTTAYLYLATHGDIEATNLRSSGYLLAYDTPYNNYNLLALGVDFLDEHLAALAAKGVQAILITDACHAGSLAGNAVAGRRLTAARLMMPQATEIRLLSSQPYELSFEGERWGGGRGVFSYYLVRGLSGAADTDHDRRIDLYELEQYVQDRVSEETQRKQHPELAGGHKGESLFGGVVEVQEEYLQEKSKAVEATFEEAQLAMASRGAQLDYVRFQRALADGKLMQPEEDCALSYYQKLRGDPSLLPLRGLLDERFTVSLLDSVQQAIQDYLDADGEELMQREQLDEKYLAFPKYLEHAAAILGTMDPRYRNIEAKRLYFEGLVLRLRTNFAPEADSLLSEAETYLHQAIALAPEAAYMHNELGIILEFQRRDSLARLTYERAKELAPTWALPHMNLSNLLKKVDPEAHFDRIVQGYQRAIALRPDLGAAYMNFGIFYQSMGEQDKAAEMLRRAVAVSPSLGEARYYLAEVLRRDPLKRKEAISVYRSLIGDRPHMTEAYLGMGLTFDSLQLRDSAEAYYIRALAVPGHRLEGYLYPNLARLYVRHQPASGKDFFRRLISESPHAPYGYAFTAVLDTTDREWSSLLSQLDLPEAEHFQLVTAVAVEVYQCNTELAVIAMQLGARLHPQLTDAHRNLTDILLVDGQWKAAERAARRAVQVAKKNQELPPLCEYVREVDLYEPLLREESLLPYYAKHCPDWPETTPED